MADSYEELAAEIGRIVNSPYPTQLKNLRDILCSRCTVSDISRWAQSMPCQIDRLAADVVDGLRQWPYVLDIIERLSLDQNCRDAILRLGPTLLRDIIVQAAKSADVQSKYATTAAAMLSHPLPKDVSLPSEVQPVFVRAFEQAAEEPSVQNIKPIYRMLQGTSSMLLSLLSSAVLLRFEEQLFSILKNVKGDNHSLCLYCLAIMTVLSTSSEERMSFSTESYDTQELLASTHMTPSRWTCDAIKQFLSGSKAQKTMQLIVLRAMWACTATTGESLDERIECLRLANEIITAVPADAREVWRKANALAVRKLEEKTLTPTLELPSRFESLCFLLRLTEGHVYPATALDTLRHMMTKDMTANARLSRISEGDANYITHCGVFDQETTTNFLQGIVDFATSATIQNILKTAPSIQVLLSELTNIMAEREGVIEGTMLALDVLSCGRKLQDLSKLLRCSHSMLNPGAEVCQTASSKAISGLVNALYKVFLTAALSPGHSTYSVPQETTSSVLELYAASSSTTDTCSHVRPRPASAPAVAFTEALSTPHARPSQWREALQSHLQQRNDLERINLTALFAKSCEELEARCESIEQPLQEQKAKTKALQHQYDELADAYAKLEADCVDRNIQYNAMEMERDQHLTDLETAREENDTLEQKIEELEAGAQQIKIDAEESAATLRREMELAELSQAAVLTKKEDELEELREARTTMESELKRKDEDLENAQAQLQGLQSAEPSFRSEIDTLKSCLDQLQIAHDRLREEKSDHMQQEQDLEAEIQAIKQNSAAAEESHKVEIAQVQEDAENDRATLLSDHETKIAAVLEQTENLKIDLLQQIEDLKQKHERMIDDYAAKAKQLHQDLTEKHRRIDKLKSKCEQKDKQIAEANAMRSNLMAAMGINGSAAKQTKLPHRPPVSSDDQLQSQQVDDQDPSPPTPLSDNVNDSQQPNLQASFASSTDSRSGPTPKRARTRRTIKVASPAKPRMSAGVATRSTRKSAVNDTAKRQPLSFVSANQGQGKSLAAKTPSKIVENVDPMDESTFEGSELFTGTQGQRMLDLDENI